MLSQLSWVFRGCICTTMGSSLRTPETYVSSVLHYNSVIEWRAIAESCRFGSEICPKLLLAKLVAEMHRYRDMYRARVQDLECLVSHFNAASELFEEETDEGHGIAALEFRSFLEAYQCLSYIIHLQRQHELGLF